VTALRSRIKSLAGQSRIARGLVLQHRLRTGQPDWSAITNTDAYRAMRARAASSKRKILIATSDGAYLGGTRVESLLALALTAREADVHVLLCDGVLPACQEATLHWYLDDGRFAKHGLGKLHCAACFSPAARMYESLGIRVHRYSDYVSATDREMAAAIARNTPWDAIRTVRHEGIAVGEHAFAGAIRFYARSYLSRRPAEEAIVRRYLEAAVLTTCVTRKLLDSHEFECATFHHGIYVPQGIIGEVARARAVRVVNWHVAYRTGRFIFSHQDTYHHTLMNEPTSAWENVAWSESLDGEVLEYLKSRWVGAGDWIHFNRMPKAEVDAIREEIGIDFSKPTIGLLTNVMWDAQLHYPANAFSDMLDWLLKTISYFETRQDLQLLIRVHPAEVTGKLPSLQPILDEIYKVRPKLPANVYVIPPASRVSTYTAMFQCDSVIIFGTKTGVELTAMGIPVIVAGEAWIRNKGITSDASTEGDYFRLLDALPRGERLADGVIKRARKYAYHFFFRRMIPIQWCQKADNQAGFEFHLDVDDLLRGRDKGVDTICDGILEGKPFIYPAELNA
jgi:hypothetical protein